MKTINTSLDLQIAVKTRMKPIVACSIIAKKVVVFLQKEITVFVEVDENAEIIGKVEFCEIMSDSLSIDDPMFFKVGTGTFNITNVRKAYSIIK